MAFRVLIGDSPMAFRYQRQTAIGAPENPLKFFSIRFREPSVGRSDETRVGRVVPSSASYIRTPGKQPSVDIDARLLSRQMIKSGFGCGGAYPASRELHSF